MKICPTSALYKRRDGIVDLNGEACIGCRACMVACPYDQLFIDPNTRTAEKCNFCANRVENQLQPACVSVCPTECRIFGDLDDPSSKVAQIVQREAFMVRKPEKGTGPKVFYLGADESAIRPEIAARPFMFREGQVHLRPLGAADPDPQRPGDPRVDYDVPHKQAWGFDLVLYLLTKGISTGALMLSARALAHGRPDAARGARRPARVRAVLHGHRGGPHHRSRAARTLSLHPHATQLDVVDGARRISPDGPWRHRRPLGRWRSCSAGQD